MRKLEHSRKHTRGSRFFAIALSGLAIGALAGCENFLAVELPGSVIAEDLNSPSLATKLALGAQSDFECGYTAWLLVASMWTSTMDQASTLTTHGNIQGRRQKVEDYGESTCHIDGSPLPFGFWGPLQIARVQGDRAIELITGFDDADVPNKNFLIGKAHAYAGYSILALSESFCELYFDAGPRETREQGWNRAVARFTSAIASLSGVTSGSDLAEAKSLTNMALVGRARAHLSLGNTADVLADAAAVDFEFVRNIDRSDLNDYRRNRIFDRSNKDLAYSVSNMESIYREVEIDGVWTLLVDGKAGVGDPRVQSTGPTTGSNGHTPMYKQKKYTSQSSPIPFASWKEAQLMIAEVDPAQSIGIINTLRAYHSLPDYVDPGDPAKVLAQVLEERRRELWMQGNRMGDMLRLKIPFATGVTPAGQTIVETTAWCFPTQIAEQQGNPNAG